MSMVFVFLYTDTVPQAVAAIDVLRVIRYTLHATRRVKECSVSAEDSHANTREGEFVYLALGHLPNFAIVTAN